MGRLINRRRMRSIASAWALPALVSAALLVGFHTAVQADTPSASQLETYLQDHTLEAFSLVKDGRQQIYYRYNDDYIQITKNPANHAYATAHDHYIAWQEETTDGGHIYLYDVLTGVQTQITSAGLNSEPDLNFNTLTWRSWDGENWQIYYYNGFGQERITSGATSSFRASTNGSKIIYAERLSPNNWRAHEYDIRTKVDTVIKEGDESSTAYPLFGANGTITTAFNTNEESNSTSESSEPASAPSAP